MPVTLTVSEIRTALYRAAGAAARGEGAPSTALLGRWFHDGLAFLVGDGRSSPVAQLADVDPDLELWKQTLVTEAYARFVGPRLTSQQAVLHADVPQVFAFWQAMQAACCWLAELNWQLRPRRPSQRAAQAAPWRALAEVVSTEESLSCMLSEPGWTDSVRLVGIADAVVRLAATGQWCAIELKLGQACPEADLGQACLYHLMLSSAGAACGKLPAGALSSDDGALALISFRPEKHERLFAGGELAGARQRLVDLIGKLAGVADSNEVNQPSPEIRPPLWWPTPLASAPATGADPGSVRHGTAATAEHRQLGQRLVVTLAEYGVGISLDEPAIAGPAFIRFPVTLGRGTKVRDVGRYALEIQVRLQLKAEPFIIRDDGRLMIDIQRPDRQIVTFDEIHGELSSSAVSHSGSRVPVGVDLSGRLICADLARPEHCHVLVAGTTGSGKSEWLRLAVAGLMETNTPETLRLLVIDPKRNAFHALRESAFLWKPLVFPDERPVAAVLAELAEEMDRRYRLFEGADSFQQLVERSGANLPRIVCVCDEYRDLISRDRNERKEVEQQICRLGAKARAAGIHLILATQEPSRDTIKGALDSNIPARVGLKMGKPIESRMLLGESGAEKLLGHGDLLFKDIGDPRRLQAPLLSEADRARIFGASSSPVTS